MDTVGAAFLGLTVGCARCHDHKFDPISQRDYYRMTALFAGSVEREIPLVSLFDVENSSRNFPLLSSGADPQADGRGAADAGGRGAEGRRQAGRCAGETGEDRSGSARAGPPDPQRAALLAAARRSVSASAGALPDGQSFSPTRRSFPKPTS